MTQDAAHKGFCWTFPLYRPSRSLEQFRTQGLESTAVQSGVPVRALNLHRDKKKRWREPGRDGKFLSNRILRIEGSAEHSRCTRLDIDLHALIMNNFEHRVLRIKPINLILLYKDVLFTLFNRRSTVLKLHRDKKS